ncbi:MAG: AgmX/PglI C-terminal domain-containing protein [Myxococcota bacterium]
MSRILLASVHSAIAIGLVLGVLTPSTAEARNRAQRRARRDVTLLDVLKYADRLGKADLGQDLDRASADLGRTRSARTGRDHLEARGAGPVVGIAIEATQPAGRLGITDLPDLDLTRTYGDVNASHESAPTIRRILRRATKRIRRCHARTRAQQPNIVGELVVELTIEPKGAVSSVLVVRSNMTETMSRCVKGTLAKIRFPAHASDEPLQITAPWRFLPSR